MGIDGGLEEAYEVIENADGYTEQDMLALMVVVRDLIRRLDAVDAELDNKLDKYL